MVNKVIKTNKGFKKPNNKVDKAKKLNMSKINS